MRDLGRLFTESLTGMNPYEQYLSQRFEHESLVTFAGNKKTPVYNWFYYKEGFSRDFVWDALEELAVPAGSVVLDPFCGTGTTLLAAAQAGFASVGFDILPLGVFVSKVKLSQDLDLELLSREVRRISSLKFGESQSKLVDVRFLDMRKAFSRYARQDIPFFKEQIMLVEDEKIRDFMLLGLLSVIGEASNVKKDGGVLRIVRKKHLPPVRYLLRNRLKRMMKDLKRAEPLSNVPWRVEQADARSLPLEDCCVDALVTSPPYLNFVDYTKLYALELSLLVSSSRELEELRSQSMRSHVGAQYKRLSGDSDFTRVLSKVTTESFGDENIPLIVEGYLKDIYLSLAEAYRVMKKGASAVYVVGNAALPGITVDVDLLLAEMAEQIGFTVSDIWVANCRWADVHGIIKKRPVRESSVVLQKE
ncbi:MAG: DNA methyltransferase [Candidatus Altiarchaeota archaeon]